MAASGSPSENNARIPLRWPGLLICSLFMVSGCGALNDQQDRVTEHQQDTPEQGYQHSPAIGPRRVISLDYCADQYLLKLADREQIAGLSTNAHKTFSYERARARGLPRVVPRAEDILIRRPDAVIRTYGGGPNAVSLLERAGIPVIQVPYAATLADIETAIANTSRELGHPTRGQALIASMRTALAPAKRHDQAKTQTVLYVTSRGAVAGSGTLIDTLIVRAGLKNFQSAYGWTSLPLERLAVEAPDLIAAGFFDSNEMYTDRWTPSNHPVARRRFRQSPTIAMPGAWTACSSWSLIEAYEALKRAARGEDQNMMRTRG